MSSTNHQLLKRIRPAWKAVQQVAEEKATSSSHLSTLLSLLDWERLEKKDREELAYHTKLEQLLQQILEEDGNESIAQLADGQLATLLPIFFGEDYMAIYRAYLQQLSRSPYTEGWERRSLRSSQAQNYLGVAAATLFRLVQISLTGYTEDTLLGTPPEEARGYYEKVWCVDIDPQAWFIGSIALGKTKVIDYFKEAMLSENNHRILTHSHFRAIMVSGNEELIELCGKLLLAARLQEGLRQSIMESCDEGTPEAFWYFYDLVQREGLLRFASVKRAIACSTGLGEDAAEDRKFEKILRLLTLYRDNLDARTAALHSKDPMEVYLALWSIGFISIEVSIPEVERIIKEAEVLQVCAAFNYVQNLRQQQLAHRLARLALYRWKDEPRVLSYVLSIYDSSIGYLLNQNSYYLHNRLPLKAFYSDEEEVVSDFHLISSLLPTLSKKQVWSGLVFPWDEVEIEATTLVHVLCALAVGSRKQELIDEVVDYLSYTTSRGYYLRNFFCPDKSEKHRSYLFTALSDRETITRDLACEWLGKIALRLEEVVQLEEHLRLKSAGMRIAIIQKLAKESDEVLAGSVERLLSDKNVERRLAGLDILQQLYAQTEKRQKLIDQLLPLTKCIKKPTAKEETLLNLLHEKREEARGEGEKGGVRSLCRANGFGFYNPKEQIALPQCDNEVDLNGFFSLLSKQKGKSDVEKALDRLDTIIEEHKDEEFIDRWGYKVLLGKSICAKDRDDVDTPLDVLAYPHLWKDFYIHELQQNFYLLLMMKLVMLFNNSYRFSTHQEIAKQVYEGVDYDVLRKLHKKLKRRDHIAEIVGQLFDEYFDGDRFVHLACVMFQRAQKAITPENMIFREGKKAYQNHIKVYLPHGDYRIDFWTLPDVQRCSDEAFVKYFTHLYPLIEHRYLYELQKDEQIENSDAYPQTIFRAYTLGLLPERAVYRMLLDNGGEGLWLYSAALHNLRIDYYVRQMLKGRTAEYFAPIRPLVDNLITTLLDIELKRGDMPTEATPFIHQIKRLEGAALFVRILSCLGKDKFLRDFYGANRDSKRWSHTHLLRVCRPLKDDTGAQLMKLVKAAGVEPEKLVEAAMLVPAWLPLVEEAIKWKGLTSAAYYFRAHTAAVMESYNYQEDNPEVQEEKAIIARYTPIELKDLAIGAFDIEWFRAAYKTLGKTRFDVVYAAAKYVSESNTHGRARKFADAVTGVLKAAATQKEIKDKRNKDLLMAYGLIPLGRNKEKDLLSRYRYIQQFLKESKEFGAQRQASEKQAVEIALQNLARNSEYGDATRLTWTMETLLVEEMSAYFAPQPLDDLLLSVLVDEAGKASLCVEKGGKTLKSLPAKYKKHRLVEKLREVVKHLKDQHVRSRHMLEQAMEQSTTFRVSEINLLMHNPVIWPLMQHLVFVEEATKAVGFYRDKALADAMGNMAMPLADDATLRIAHAVDLYHSGKWSEFQQSLFEHQISQPFKQVFRELYLPTEEEREQERSMRYAGHQIMPQRAVALLKKRKWVATYEEGLQRVYHKEGIIATIYAMADWFSPSDIEAPTLEYVCFYDRSTYRPLRLEEVPAILFSEVMRDVDLVVSVAHAGGVDPEASHSTIEMRAAIVACTLPLFRLVNVKIKGSHVHIEGKLGRYSVHLGSGVVHQDAGAAINILPVHSQSRGRLFLPFVDEDPKTAEILSKVLLLAEDERIKDPFILEQIVQ